MKDVTMDAVVGLTLISLVAILAWPRMRSHQWILPLMYRGGQMLLLTALAAAGTAVVFPWGLQSIMQWFHENTPEIVASGAKITLDGLLIIGSVLLLILMAPLAAWHEAQKVLASAAHVDRGAQKTRSAATSRIATLSSTSSTAEPERDELEVILERMKRQAVTD